MAHRYHIPAGYARSINGRQGNREKTNNWNHGLARAHECQVWVGLLAIDKECNKTMSEIPVA